MTDATVSNQGRLPDPETCRTVYLGGYCAFYCCLVENPNCCERAVRFGDGFLCVHTGRRSFEKAPETTRPHQQMTDQHRKHLSKSMKKAWAKQGGVSSETRQMISASVKKRWVERRQMPDKH
jgi:hypothetical protein